MPGIPTLLLFFAFLTMCAILFFTRKSKTYDDAAKLPLDETADEKSNEHEESK